MKLAIIAAVAVFAVAGCASISRDGTIKTPSVVYDAELAAKAGLTQAQTDVCVAQGRERLLSVGVGGSMTGGFGWLEGGRTFDACVNKTARK